ncbi:Serine/threonine protein kinase [Syntrophus gentianae]|uniref:Serine/threonine protein kinase n=1 Tax=Syntrophus gentianae TaxID=43775 RepID=A0A1H8A5P8_9BACT|nr:protein kinase [Syntrophus gentianae]SEM66020.1 Serine/threonine protein kinase [Syntrophus gentianae]
MDLKNYILLVNRDKKFLNTVCKSLLEAGYPVLTATAMSSAMNLLSNNSVALIISDSELDDSNGYEFLEFLKNTPFLKKIPFVFFVPIHDQKSAGKAFGMGAADFIVYTPNGETPTVLIERIGEMLPATAVKARTSVMQNEGLHQSFTPRLEAVSATPVECRKSERIIPKQIVNLELSRDSILWLPGRVKNISKQGLLIETSLLGRLGMVLYIRVPLPSGTCVIESHIRHISINNHQLSAEIGVETEQSIDWIETYDYIVNLKENERKPTARKSPVVDEIPVEKKINADMIIRMNDNKPAPADPLFNNFGEPRSEKALEIKFYRSLVGKQLGNYKAVSFIGAGGMGGVFKGWDVVLERNVALKVISYNLSSIASYRDMFVKEARLVSRLTHPNIAQIYYIDQMDDVLYFAMELINGGTLADFIKDHNNLNTAKGLEHFITICRTLDFVSRQNIVHRDIKPANIMIDDNGMLKVVDFGVSIVNDGSGNKKRKPEGLVGSPLFASPDCIMGRPLDCRSDIYSLGATFYNVFAGAPPFDGECVEAILFKHLNEELVPLKKKNPILSSELSDIIGKMMAKNPDDRYQDYQSIIHDLNVLMH